MCAFCSLAKPLHHLSLMNNERSFCISSHPETLKWLLSHDKQDFKEKQGLMKTEFWTNTRSTCFCRSLQMLGLLWVENFVQKAECPNTGKMSVNYSAVLLRSSIEFEIWCPLILLLEGDRETALPRARTAMLWRQACCGQSEGVIYHGKRNPRRREGAQCPMPDWGMWISVEKPMYSTGKLLRFCLSTFLWEACSAGRKLKLGRGM